jgi:hypothetical protein
MPVIRMRGLRRSDERRSEDLQTGRQMFEFERQAYVHPDMSNGQECCPLGYSVGIPIRISFAVAELLSQANSYFESDAGAECRGGVTW